MFKKAIFILVAGVFLFGCAKKQVLKSDRDSMVPPGQEDVDETSIRYDDWTKISELKTVNFDYDSSVLTDSARAVLKKNAEYLKSNPDITVLVAGHCDERGTIEYNLALGQRRAAAVRRYYGNLGVKLGNIGTISYGEEDPVDPASNETAWSKNRRAETKVRKK
ncbi:MAG: peptidoglycan-associated lipoprotein Pal [Endomicrobiales bacterium]|nr:peptidoglycan-associated lipoprotein Pal [Endomicrobiales bacterium]